MKTGFGVWTRTAAIVSIAVFDRETISPQMNVYVADTADAAARERRAELTGNG